MVFGLLSTVMLAPFVRTPSLRASLTGAFTNMMSPTTFLLNSGFQWLIS
jgi:hypothetical protein